MPDTDRAHRGEPSRGKRKVMIYVPWDVHRSIRQLALDEGRSASDVYERAARALLAQHGTAAGTVPDATAFRGSSMDEIAEAVDRQGKRIDDLHALIVSTTMTQHPGMQARTATKAAEAMETILDLVRAAGAAGLASRDLDAGGRAAGASSGSMETAKAILRTAGLVRFEARRWYVTGPDR